MIANLNRLIWFMVFNATQYFSYIVVVSFIGGRGGMVI
jgi:hypothetical protein